MNIYYASNLICELSNKVYKCFFLPLPEFEKCYYWRPEGICFRGGEVQTPSSIRWNSRWKATLCEYTIPESSLLMWSRRHTLGCLRYHIITSRHKMLQCALSKQCYHWTFLRMRNKKLQISSSWIFFGWMTINGGPLTSLLLIARTFNISLPNNIFTTVGYVGNSLLSPLIRSRIQTGKNEALNSTIRDRNAPLTNYSIGLR